MEREIAAAQRRIAQGESVETGTATDREAYAEARRRVMDLIEPGETRPGLANEADAIAARYPQDPETDDPLGASRGDEYTINLLRLGPKRCRDLAASAQVKPLRRMPALVFSSSAPDAVADGCKSRSNRRSLERNSCGTRPRVPNLVIKACSSALAAVLALPERDRCHTQDLPGVAVDGQSQGASAIVTCHWSFIQPRPEPGGHLRLLARVEQSPGARNFHRVQRDGRLRW